MYSSQDAEPNSLNIFNETKLEWQTRLNRKYQENFGTGLEFDNWGSKPAEKQSAKTILNSGWGKHAESVDHIQTKFIDELNTGEAFEFYTKIQKEDVHISSIIQSSSRTEFKYSDNREKIKAKLHKTYLPAAVFVPMYGRLMLYNQLDKLGERVIAMDTDSIKYITGSPDDYQIKGGDMPGDWEHELTKTVEYVSLGLKTYGQKMEDGTSFFKCKGLNIKYAHGNYLNFEIAKECLYDGKIVYFPEQTFKWTPTGYMETVKYTKLFSFQPDQLKGNYDPTNHKVYPFGYQK